MKRHNKDTKEEDDDDDFVPIKKEMVIKALPKPTPTPTPEMVQDKAQSKLETGWGKAASSIWKASYISVQKTWREMLDKDLLRYQWGQDENECCWEVNLASNNGRPTKEINRRHKRRTQSEINAGVPKKGGPRVRPYCTHIALRATQKFPLPKFKVTDASHLCHNPKCANPDHLIVETRKANHSRKNCLFKIMCPHCDDEILVCTHDPPCLHSAIWSED